MERNELNNPAEPRAVKRRAKCGTTRTQLQTTMINLLDLFFQNDAPQPTAGVKSVSVEQEGSESKASEEDAEGEPDNLQNVDSEEDLTDPDPNDSPPTIHYYKSNSLQFQQQASWKGQNNVVSDRYRRLYQRRTRQHIPALKRRTSVVVEDYDWAKFARELSIRRDEYRLRLQAQYLGIVWRIERGRVFVSEFSTYEGVILPAQSCSMIALDDELLSINKIPLRTLDLVAKTDLLSRLDLLTQNGVELTFRYADYPIISTTYDSTMDQNTVLEGPSSRASSRQPSRPPSTRARIEDALFDFLGRLFLLYLFASPSFVLTRILVLDDEHTPTVTPMKNLPTDDHDQKQTRFELRSIL